MVRGSQESERLLDVGQRGQRAVERDDPCQDGHNLGVQAELDFPPRLAGAQRCQVDLDDII
eukprot:7165885-Prymnesium_polylepis.1